MGLADFFFATTDLRRKPSRRLAQQFGSSDKAIGTSAPNTLHSNLPRLADAMGTVPASGILSFIHDGATQDMEIYEWHAGVNRVTAAQGWVLIAESAALSAKNVLAYAIASVKMTPGAPFFIKAGSSTVNNCWVNGQAHESNKNSHAVQ